MKKLYRSRRDRVISGVCGGLSDYLKVDPFFIRLVFVLVMIFTGILPLTLAYFIAALIMPLAPKSYQPQKFKRLYRSKKRRVVAGILGGISEVYHIDPTILRLIFIALFFFTGLFPLLISYIIGIFIIPQK